MNKALTLILCSRNDSYMGNPMGRLELALNYLAENVRALDREDDVEVIVTDWGSTTPLGLALDLTPAAARITRFLEVPIVIVNEVQKDTPFAEVIALNAAVRCSTGTYIGRIDQDTLTGKRFLENFFAWLEGREAEGINLGHTFLFSRRRQIPFAFANANPTLEQVSQLIASCGSSMLVETNGTLINSPVGIMLVSRKMWDECGGYDERMIYYGWMEVDLSIRVKEKYPLIDLGTYIAHDFYHLEHYDPGTPRKTPRRMNEEISDGLTFHPNADSWGLLHHSLCLQSYPANAATNAGKPLPHGVDDALWQKTDREVKRDFRRRAFAQSLRGLAQPGRYLEYFLRLTGLRRDAWR